MMGLVKRQISATRKLDAGPRSPVHVSHRVRNRDALSRQVCEGRLDVRAHQLVFPLRLALRGVYCGLAWR